MGISLRELNLEDLPLLGGEPALNVSGKGLGRLRVTSILEVVVTDRELSVRLLDVGAINDADVAASEYRSLLWVAGHCELGQVEVEFFLEIDGVDKGIHRFVCRPVFFAGVPSQWRETSDNFAVLRLHDGKGVSDVIALFMKLQSGEVVLAGSVQEGHALDGFLGEERANVLMVISDTRTEPGDGADCSRNSGRKRCQFVFFRLTYIEILNPIQ